MKLHMLCCHWVWQDCSTLTAPNIGPSPTLKYFYWELNEAEQKGEPPKGGWTVIRLLSLCIITVVEHWWTSEWHPEPVWISLFVKVTPCHSRYPTSFAADCITAGSQPCQMASGLLQKPLNAILSPGWGNFWQWMCLDGSARINSSVNMLRTHHLSSSLPFAAECESPPLWHCKLNFLLHLTDTCGNKCWNESNKPWFSTHQAFC